MQSIDGIADQISQDLANLTIKAHDRGDGAFSPFYSYARIY